MADEEIVETTTEETVAVEEPKAVEETKAVETDGEDKSKTLLSGDEGEETDAPVEYKFDAPDGVAVDEAKLAVFAEKAAEMKLTPEQYQQLIDYDIERGISAQAAMAQEYLDRVAKWGDQTKQDKEIGGEKLADNLSLAKRSFDTFGSPELKALLDAPSEKNPEGLGLGNHPAMIKFFHRVGKAISESDLVAGDSVVEGPDALERMYPTMFQKTG